MGRLKEELPDHQGSTPKVIPKGMTKGKGWGALAYPRETKQTPGMDMQTFLEAGGYLADFSESLVLTLGGCHSISRPIIHINY